MRYAIISDIHCNYPMLKQCVEDAIAQKIEHFIFLGDYVTDGYTGNMVVSFLKKLSEKYHCEFIYGNREKYIRTYHEKSDEFNKRLNRVSLGYKSLSKESHDWLNSLSEIRIINIDGLSFLLIHGDSFDLRNTIFMNYKLLLDRFDFDVCLYGHTHILRDDIYKNRRFINPGTLSYPRRNDLSYCIIDVDCKKVVVQYHMFKINQELVKELCNYFIETGYYEENKIWTEMLLNWVCDKYEYVEEFMFRLRQLSSKRKFISSSDYNYFFEKEYEKFAKEKKLLRIKDVQMK